MSKKPENRKSVSLMGVIEHAFNPSTLSSIQCYLHREFQANQGYLGIPWGWGMWSRLSLYTPSWSGTQFCAQAHPEFIIPLPTHVVPAQCKTLKVIKKDELKSS